MTRTQRVGLAGGWAGLLTSGGLFLGACGHHHHGEGPPPPVVVTDSQGYRHEGYYDQGGGWHGGYYDERREYHEDRGDWHGDRDRGREPDREHDRRD